MRPIRTVPPVEQPITLDMLKADRRVDFDDEDAVVQRYINRAIAYVDGYEGILGRCLCIQTWRMYFPGWERVMNLPFPDVSAVVVNYRDADGVDQVLADTEYYMSRGSLTGEVTIWGDMPALDNSKPEPVWIDFTAGYGGADDVPDDIKDALILLAGVRYDERMGGAIPDGVKDLLAPHRRVGV